MKEKMIRKNYRLGMETLVYLHEIQSYFHISESEAVRLAVKEFFHTEFGMRLIPAVNLQRMIEQHKLSPTAIVLVEGSDFCEDSGAINLSPAVSEWFADGVVERILEFTDEDDELLF